MFRYRFPMAWALAVLAAVALGGFGVWYWGSDDAVIAMGVVIVGAGWIGVVLLAALPFLILVWAAFAIPLRLVRRYTGRDRAPAKETITDGPEP